MRTRWRLIPDLLHSGHYVWKEITPVNVMPRKYACPKSYFWSGSPLTDIVTQGVATLDNRRVDQHHQLTDH